MGSKGRLTAGARKGNSIMLCEEVAPSKTKKKYKGKKTKETLRRSPMRKSPLPVSPEFAPGPLSILVLEPAR